MSGPAPGDAAQRPLRVIVAHNAYLQKGGEDGVVAAEVALLKSCGHEVFVLHRSNEEIAAMNVVPLAAATIWSAGTHARMSELIAAHRPDVVHVHNTLPLLSPSLHWGAADAGVAVVQTLHNFRLDCPQGMYLRNGRVCEDCAGRTPWPAITHACYRQSAAQSAVVVTMLAVHRAIGTWRRKVDRFIALTDFSRRKFVAAGLAADRIVVKPNFVEDGTPGTAELHGFLFVGRLAEEKGIDVLAAACQEPGARVRVAGEGPLGPRLQGIARVERLGALSPADVHREMDGALALVLPSICYENFPRAVAEAFACGLPVIASRIGSLAELVDDGVTGLLFEAGAPAELARAMRWAESHPERMAAMGRAARLRYEKLYTPEVNHGQLLQVYRAAIAQRRSAAARHP